MTHQTPNPPPFMIWPGCIKNYTRTFAQAFNTLLSMSRSDSVTFQFDGMFDIPNVRRDASALTIHSDTGHLWVITDDQVRLVEFTNQGQFIREVNLIDLDDAEGLCHVGGDLFLVAEEKKMCFTLINVPPGSTRVKADGRCIQLDVKSKKNKGLEGVSYDAQTDTLFAVRENKPPAVYRIQPLLAKGRSKISEWSLNLDGLDDLSDTFSSNGGNHGRGYFRK